MERLARIAFNRRLWNPWSRDRVNRFHDALTEAAKVVLPLAVARGPWIPILRPYETQPTSFFSVQKDGTVNISVQLDHGDGEVEYYTLDYKDVEQWPDHEHAGLLMTIARALAGKPK
jgi:hypothetical protein